MQYQCCGVATENTCVSKSTSPNSDGNGGVVYMDRHKVRCQADSLIRDWKLVDLSGGKISIDYCCAKAKRSLTCRTTSTSFNSDGGRSWGGVIYLDRHNVQCRNNEGLQQWSMARSSNHKKMKIDYVCCTETPTPKPTPQPTPQPTAPPTDTPTVAPTESPTESPTELPTQEPTETPTEEPTEPFTPDDVTTTTMEPLTTPAPVDDCLECRLDFSKLTHNPFDNVPPQTFNQDQHLIFNKVCEVSGESYDLAINIASGYWSNRPEQNHAVGSMFRLNMKAGSNATATFKLLKNGQPAEDDVKILFSLLDLDRGDNTLQWADVSHVFQYRQGPNVTVTQIDGKHHFLSQRIGNGADNPHDPMMLSPEALNSGVAVQTSAQFAVTFGISGSDPNGRMFYFAGASTLKPSFCNDDD